MNRTQAFSFSDKKVKNELQSRYETISAFNELEGVKCIINFNEKVNQKKKALSYRNCNTSHNRSFLSEE